MDEINFVELFRQLASKVCVSPEQQAGEDDGLVLPEDSFDEQEVTG